MKPAALAFAAILCAVPAVLAQDAPKPAPPTAPTAEKSALVRHVNKISDAARAVFEKFDKIVYTPLKGGLKDLSGAMKMEMEFGGPDAEEMKASMGAMGSMELTFAVTFKAPSEIKVEMKDAPGKGEADRAGGGMGAGMMKRMGEGMSASVSSLFKFTILGCKPAEDQEFDADVKTENGKTVLVMTTYTKGVETGHSEITLDDRGLPETSVVAEKTAGPPPAPPPGRGMRGGEPRGADGRSTIKFSYSKEGDLFRLDKMKISDGSRGGSVEANLSYADVGGFKMVHSFMMQPADGPMKFGFKFSDLIVNGKKVDLGGGTEKAAVKKGGMEEEDEKDEEKDEEDEGKEKK